MSGANVMQLAADPRYLALAFRSDALRRLGDAERGSWASWWSSMRADVVQLDDDVRSPMLGTAPWNNSVQLMTVASSIKEACTEILGPYGEFLPVDTDRGVVWAFHCLNEAHAIDEEMTEGALWADDASLPGGRRLLYVTNIKFRHEVAQEARVFVLPERGGRGVIYFTRDVVDELNGIDAGFTGSSWRAPF